MLLLQRLFLTAVVLMTTAATASAHFLWLAAGKGSPDGKLHVYFGESASPDDPELLEKVKSVKVFGAVREGRKLEWKEIPVAQAKSNSDSLSGDYPEKAIAAVLTYDYGVISRKGESFLLRYSAKAYPMATPSSWQKIEDNDHLALEIVPRWSGAKLELTVLWKGKPLAGSEVAFSGVGLDEEKLNTDDNGRVEIEPKKNGLLSVRAKQTIDEKGESNGMTYSQIRHYSTVAVPVELPSVISDTSTLAPLPKGTTSFGAAVSGDAIYAYGGNYGGAHHYSEEEQSGDLWKLSLKPGSKWEQLTSGPKRTGTAMVEHNGKLYRIGGFTARNTADKDQDLWSESDVSVYDIASKTWSPMTELPKGRSSFDAAILVGKLYVIGGWTLAGKEKSVWHETGLVYDLSAKDGKWEEFPVPFKRRALSVAAFEGRLYVIGGMQDDNKTTTRVDIYNPSTKEWSEGPALVGTSMDGFGNSSFASAGKLYATTMAGSLQQLSADGKEWIPVGQLNSPRFFHRLLPLPGGRLVAFGGASMVSGKATEVELLVPRTK